MSQEDQFKTAIQKSLETQDAPELEISQVLDKYFVDPEDRLKSLYYLASLELLKLKGRSIDRNDPSLIFSVFAAVVHTLIEMVFPDDRELQLAIVEQLKHGIVYEAILEEQIKDKVPKPEEKDVKDWR